MKKGVGSAMPVDLVSVRTLQGLKVEKLEKVTATCFQLAAVTFSK